ncbi:MAG: response regulator [Kiritimatiellales bacterium]|nr:response regulator [Kiritimatiellales bacterium]
MKHLLVVDDDYGARESLRTVFAPDYHVTLSTNAADAKRVLAVNNIDLMLLDVIMPRQDGVSLIREISADYPDLPVIMISASTSIKPVVESMRAGAIDFITKPFDVDDIRSRVATLLKNNTRKAAGKKPSGSPASIDPDDIELPVNLADAVSDFERRLITQALWKSGGIQTRAAELLGTTRRILRYRMEKLNITLPDTKPRKI